MDDFGVQFRVNDERRFAALCRVYAAVKYDNDRNAFWPAAQCSELVPDDVKPSFDWPTAEERAKWTAARPNTVILIAQPARQLGQRWDFYRVFEALEESDYAVLGCERVAPDVGELRIDPCFGYPYGGVGPLIALAEAFGFDVLGVNECGRFESRSELLGNGSAG